MLAHSSTVLGCGAIYCQGLYDQALIKFLSQRLSKKLRAREYIEKWRIWCLRSVGTQTNDKKTKCSKAKKTKTRESRNQNAFKGEQKLKTRVRSRNASGDLKANKQKAKTEV